MPGSAVTQRVARGTRFHYCPIRTLVVPWAPQQCAPLSPAENQLMPLPHGIRGWRRSRLLLLALSAGTLLACRQRASTVDTTAATLSGYLSVVVGDPAPPGGAPQVIVHLTTEDGRTLTLQADSAHAEELREAPRFQRTRVRVTGRFERGDSTTFWVERLDSLPPGGTR